MIEEAPGCLGTKERMVELTIDGRKAYVKNADIESKTSAPINGQAAL